MKHIVWIAVLMIIPFHAAQAASCGKWVASVSSLMGEGTELNAHACTDAKGMKSDFEITCAGKKKLMVRFAPVDGTGDTDFENVSVSLSYDVDGSAFPVITQYEGLDGAFVADFPVDHPLIAAMQHGQKITITDGSKKLPNYQMSLKGARKALDTMIKACR